MRDIRARISQRHGIELSNQQVQELAARRLDAILEPRNVNPSLLAQLRKSAGDTTDVALPPSEPPYTFVETTLYDTHRGLLGFIRRLLHPILKLFFNPTPIANALQAQAQFNASVTAREVERERRQAEWNALHYELLQRMVTEVARVSIDVQALATRVESLSAKVDFNERRVRALENPQQPNRPQIHRPAGPSEPVNIASGSGVEPGASETASAEHTGDGPRKRRRRRRGRRGGAPGGDMPGASGEAALAQGDADEVDGGDTGEPDDDEAADGGGGEDRRVSPEPAHGISPVQPAQPQAAAEPVVTHHDAVPPQPEAPRDEPTPMAPGDHADPGPPDR
jgi:hypothetical protein